MTITIVPQLTEGNSVGGEAPSAPFGVLITVDKRDMCRQSSAYMVYKKRSKNETSSFLSNFC